MEQLIELGALLFVAAYLSASVVFWLWWSMGSPQVDADSGLAFAEKGRLFSFYGTFIANRYNDIESNPNRTQRPNFYKALGACVFCFSVWACLAMSFAWGYIANRYLQPDLCALGWAFLCPNYIFLTLSMLKKQHFSA